MLHDSRIARHFGAYHPQKPPQSRQSDALQVARMFGPFPCPRAGAHALLSALATETLSTEDSLFPDTDADSILA